MQEFLHRRGRSRLRLRFRQRLLSAGRSVILVVEIPGRVQQRRLGIRLTYPVRQGLNDARKTTPTLIKLKKTQLRFARHAPPPHSFNFNTYQGTFKGRFSQCQRGAVARWGWMGGFSPRIYHRGDSHYTCAFQWYSVTDQFFQKKKNQFSVSARISI